MVVDFLLHLAPEARKIPRFDLQIYAAQRLNAAGIGFLSC